MMAAIQIIEPQADVVVPRATPPAHQREPDPRWRCKVKRHTYARPADSRTQFGIVPKSAGLSARD
jgi:hypothetical protein